MSAAYETIDPLLDYMATYSPLSAESEAVVQEAWAQHDAYPCRSGDAIRKDIVATALSQLVELNTKRNSRTRLISYTKGLVSVTTQLDSQRLLVASNHNAHNPGVQELMACHD